MVYVANTPEPHQARSGEPSLAARLLAFGAIVIGGLAGGFIGWALVDLQCSGDCTVLAGLIGLASAVVAAVGVGIVAVLALRAIGEWQAQEARGATAPPARELIARRKDQPPARRKTPRVK